MFTVIFINKDTGVIVRDCNAVNYYSSIEVQAIRYCYYINTVKITHNFPIRNECLLKSNGSYSKDASWCCVIHYEVCKQISVFIVTGKIKRE